MRAAGERALVALGVLAAGLSCLLLIPAWLPSALAGAGLLGICLVWVNVGIVTVLQRRTPADLLGRVGAALDVAVTAPQAVSIAVGAALIAVVDYRVLLGLMAAVLTAAAGYLAARRQAGAGPTAVRDVLVAAPDAPAPVAPGGPAPPQT